MVSVTDGTTTTTADAILSASLDLDLGRIDESGFLVFGTPAALTGSVTYLHPTLSSALAMLDLYAGTALLTLDADGSGIDGLQHYATGSPQIRSETTLNGKSCRWSLTVPIRKAT